LAPVCNQSPNHGEAGKTLAQLEQPLIQNPRICPPISCHFKHFHTFLPITKCSGSFCETDHNIPNYSCHFHMKKKKSKKKKKKLLYHGKSKTQNLIGYLELESDVEDTFAAKYLILSAKHVLPPSI
jgi:hypothetical protein